MKAHQRTIGLNDEWLTPQGIIRELGQFDLDPCSPSERPWNTAHKHISLPDDGLTSEWHGRVWLNPPFNRKTRPKWMEKMANHGNGIMLIPAATETKAFYKYVWDRAQAVCFVRSRPHFHFINGERAKANCGTAIALVAYGNENIFSLKDSKLGKVIVL